MPEMCPYCGSAPAGTGLPRAEADHTRNDPLFAEIRRIREIAESQQFTAERQTVERLSHEVLKLRETVARLRGSAAARPASPEVTLSAPRA